MWVLREQRNKPLFTRNKIEEGFVEDKLNIQRVAAFGHRQQQRTFRQQPGRVVWRAEKQAVQLRG